MRVFLSAVLLSATAVLSLAEEVVFRNDFNTPGSLDGWNRPPAMRYEAQGGIADSGCVLFENTRKDQSSLAAIPLEVEKLQGRAVLVEGWMKAEEVGRPELSYLGPKLMLAVTGRDGGKNHPDQEKAFGSYDWRKFTVFARIPHSAQKVELCIGLQGCTGKVWVDDVKVSLVPAPTPPAPVRYGNGSSGNFVRRLTRSNQACGRSLRPSVSFIAARSTLRSK